METTVKITKEKLNIFVAIGKHFVNTTPKSKLWFAVDKILRLAKKKLKKVEQERDEKRREFAAKKDKGLFDLNERGEYQFNDDNLKKLNEALLEIDEEEVEIPFHIIPDGENDETKLSFDMRENFEGIVIPSVDYETFDIDNYVAPKEEDKKE